MTIAVFSVPGGLLAGRGASRVVRPPGFEPCAVERRSRWLAQLGPSGKPLFWRVIKRNGVAARKQNPVECADSGDESGARVRLKHGGDRGIGALALHARIVEASLLRRRLGRPAEALLVARRERGGPRRLHHVEVEICAPPLKLRRI